MTLGAFATYRPTIAITALIIGTAVGCTGESVVPPVPTDTGRVGPPQPIQNRPPQLYKIGDKYVALGQKLVIEPRASDADGDPLSFFVQPLPKGASFQKFPPRFTWTPSSLQTVSPTFVVSDGEETDRETVQVRVVSEVQNHAPVFQPIGDQALEVGDTYTLQLQASDADGDPITFAVDDLPAGASLDEASGLFGWIAPPVLEGTSPTLTFSVSDGQETAFLAVRFYVLAPGQNKPPTFSPLSPQSATVGQAYSLTLSATDPDGDALQFDFEGNLPTGAGFDPTTARFTWTPSDSQAGETWELRFSVTDGIYNIFQVVDVQVLTPSTGPTACEDDPGEPNNDPEFATPINAGSYDDLWLCDTDVSPVDEDWYAISLATEQTLSITLIFTHALGDLDVALYKASDLSAPVALADSATDNEVISYVTPQLGMYLLRVYGIGQLQFDSAYVLELSTSGLSCDDDNYEPNDSSSEASAVTPGVMISDAMYCPGDTDWWSVNLSCGAQLATQITADNSVGTVQLTAYRENQLVDAIGTIDSTGTAGSLFYTAPLSEVVYLEVAGDPPESTLGGYNLLTQISGSATCTDDNKEPNQTKMGATQLSTPTDELNDLSLCCNEDWFFVPVQVGSALLAAITFEPDANVNAWVYALDGDEPLATAETDVQGLLLELNPAPFSGNFYIRIEGDPGTQYDLELIVTESAGCAPSKGCLANEICWKATGICLDDACVDDTDCPFGQDMPCEANQCLDGCTYDSDCKLGWACKGFDYGRYCGPDGNGTTGAACTVFSECDGPGACAFPQAGGYCTNFGCSSNVSCSGAASCVQYNTTTLCAAHCNSNADCRTEDGHTCQPKKLVNNLDVNVCLPAL